MNHNVNSNLVNSNLVNSAHCFQEENSENFHKKRWFRCHFFLPQKDNAIPAHLKKIQCGLFLVRKCWFLVRKCQNSNSPKFKLAGIIKCGAFLIKIIIIFFSIIIIIFIKKVPHLIISLRKNSGEFEFWIDEHADPTPRPYPPPL